MREPVGHKMLVPLQDQPSVHQRQPNVPALKAFIYLFAPRINSSKSWWTGLGYSMPAEKSLIKQPGCRNPAP